MPEFRRKVMTLSSSGKMRHFPKSNSRIGAALQARSMFASKCLFCGHPNPAGAKFCNNCSEPLHLKPCEQCDAINDAPATNCYKCGAEFTARRAAESSSAVVAAETAVASFVSGDSDIERGHTPLPQRATESLNVLQRPSGDDFPGAREHVEMVAREPRRLTSGVTRFFFAEQRATHVIPVRRVVAIAQRARIARVALPVLLAAALAQSGYYVYRDPQSDLGGSSSAIRTSPSVVPAETGVRATPSLGMVGMSTEA